MTATRWPRSWRHAEGDYAPPDLTFIYAYPMIAMDQCVQNVPIHYLQIVASRANGKHLKPRDPRICGVSCV